MYRYCSYLAGIFLRDISLLKSKIKILYLHLKYDVIKQTYIFMSYMK